MKADRLWAEFQQAEKEALATYWELCEDLPPQEAKQHRQYQQKAAQAKKKYAAFLKAARP